jgi:SH3-like domain-containing protein
MIAFVAALAGLLVFFLARVVIVRQISFWAGILLIVISVFTFNFSRKQYAKSQNEPQAIIITPSVVVKSSPSDGGTDLFLIHEGLKVTVTDKLGSWREIKLSDGNEGWIKNSDLEEI